MARKAAGLSLIELLICLGIIAFLALKASTPGFASWRERKEVDGVMRELIGAVDLARAHAIAENVMVTFCRSNDGQNCQGKWHEGSILFTDFNADRVMNGDDRLLFRLEPMPAAGTLEFRSFQNRQYLQMTSRGFTNYQNGNFTFCPASGDPRMARQVIVSFTGRTRFARDGDGDGIVEDSQGRPLSCK
ncbi:MAG: GspH/FimT family pseudopilin [Gammaproteobacteria bacterium]